MRNVYQVDTDHSASSIAHLDALIFSVRKTQAHAPKDVGMDTLEAKTIVFHVQNIALNAAIVNTVMNACPDILDLFANIPAMEVVLIRCVVKSMGTAQMAV